MKRFNSKQAEGYSPYTCIGALQQGNAVTRLSALVLGLGNMLNGQLIKGLLFLAGELFIRYPAPLKARPSRFHPAAQ